jgi:hypothetical protein
MLPDGLGACADTGANSTWRDDGCLPGPTMMSSRTEERNPSNRYSPTTQPNNLPVWRIMLWPLEADHHLYKPGIGPAYAVTSTQGAYCETKI